MQALRYRGYRFPPAIIQHTVWLYLRFTLSFRDVEDLMAERGVTVSYETIRRWMTHFGPIYARRLRAMRPPPTGRWHLDEMFVPIAGRQRYLWRAVDDEGEVLDVLVQARRDKDAALRLMRKLLKNQRFVPTSIVTDRYRAYDAALRDLGFSHLHRRGKRLNNRAESSHVPIRRREHKMQGSDPALSQKILDIPEAQCVSQIQPARMLDDRWREPVASVAKHFHRKTLPAVTWRGHGQT
jgi:putative transposase